MNTLKTSLSLIAAILCTGAAHAAETTGQVDFSGSVYSQTCTIATTSKDKKVILPPVRASALMTAGIASKEKETFDLVLSGCTAGMTAGVLFDQTNVDSANSGTLINTSTGASAAKNVNIQIALADGTAIKLNEQTKDHYREVVKDDVDQKYGYIASYFSTGKATAGSVTSYATFKVDYK